MPPSGLHLARDHDHNAVAAHVRRDEWERLSRGAYGATAARWGRKERALAKARAVHERLVTPHWFSHETAALIWGLPVWQVPDVTHLRRRGRAGTGRDRSVARHAGELDERHLTVVGHLPVTDLEQTMVDCARSLSPLGGLVVADAALRAGADRGTALAVLDAEPGRRGVARARAVIELADEGAESPGETVTRYVLLREGLPQPQTQIPVVTRLGTFWADLGWEEWQVFLEYDGRAKYADTEAWVREKRRHDAVVETGAHMLRVTKEDIPQRAGLAARALRLLPAGIERTRRPLLRA